MTHDMPATRNSPHSAKFGLWLYFAIAGSIFLGIAMYVLASHKSLMFYDIGSDTFFAFYPLQILVAKQLHALHSISWSFELGLGSYVGNLLDPAWLLAGWFPVNWQIDLRLPIYLLKIFTAGAFLYAYLRRIGITQYVAVIGGLGYAFSSYSMINAQWGAMHGTEFVQLAGYLYLMERYLQTEGRWSAVFAGILVGLGNAFGLYLFALVTVLYMVVRGMFFPEPVNRQLLLKYARFGLFCIAGLAIVAPLLFPAIHYFLDSPRIFGVDSVFQAMLTQIFSINTSPTIASEIGGLLGKNIFGIGSAYRGWGNYFEGPGFYCGLLALFGLPQLIGPRATNRERWLFCFGASFIALFMIFPALRYVVYAFGHSAFRFSTLLVQTLILIMGIVGLRRALINRPWLPGIFIGLLIILAILAGSIWLGDAKPDRGYMVNVLVFAVAYCAILGLAAVQRIASTPLCLTLLAVMVAELAVLSVPSVVERDMVAASGKSPVGSYHDGTEAALALIHAREPKGSFYRIEKTYRSVFLDDSLVQGYRGTQSYYFHGSSIPRFYQSMNVPFMMNSVNYVQAPLNRPLLLDILGVKYMLTRGRAFNTRHNPNFIGSTNGISVFERPTALPVARFVNSVTSEAAADALPPAQRDRLLLDTVIVKDPDSLTSSLAPAATSTNGSASVQLDISRDNLLVGKVSTDHPRLLLLSIPFDRGWRAFVGQDEVKPFRADYGLTAMVVPAGIHQLKLAYSPVGRVLGWWVSLFTLLGLIARPRLAPRLSMK